MTTGGRRLEVELEITTLCRGFLFAYGERALERAVVVWMRQRSLEAQAVLEVVLVRLHAQSAS